MPDEKEINLLAELLKARGPCLPIRVLIEALGPEEYTACLEDLFSRDEDDPERAGVFCANGDSRPTHIYIGDWFMEWMSEKLDTALEKQGYLSPRTKGLTKH